MLFGTGYKTCVYGKQCGSDGCMDNCMHYIKNRSFMKDTGFDKVLQDAWGDDPFESARKSLNDLGGKVIVIKGRVGP